VISLSLSNFIKTILNIQDDNISFPEEDYCQIIQKRTAFGYSNFSNFKKHILIQAGIISIIQKKENLLRFYSQKIL